jgi:hypothetical protein
MRNTFKTGLALMALFAIPRACSGSPVRIQVTDPTGAGAANVLVILKSLDGKGELFRGLSGPNGYIRQLDEPPGLYQAIATMPYGAWKSQVTEFLLTNQATLLELRLEPLPTHGYGDVHYVGTEIDLTVLGQSGQPLASTWIYARNQLATVDTSVTTDLGGKSKC